MLFTTQEYAVLIDGIVQVANSAGVNLGESPPPEGTAEREIYDLHKKLIQLRSQADLMEAADEIASIPHGGAGAARARASRTQEPARLAKPADGPMIVIDPPSPEHVQIKK